jgi:hypothetical protein
MATELPAADAQVNAQQAADAQVNAQPATEGQVAGGKQLTDADAALLKENMAMKRKLQAIEAQQTAAEKRALEEQGKHKELAQLHERKANALADRLIKAELVARMPGLIKPDLIKLCDTTGLQIGDDGSIEGIGEVVANFTAANPEYFSANHAENRPAVPGTPKPGTTAAGVGYRTYEEYEQAPRDQQIEWATKNPAAFKALADAAMRQKG